MRAAEAAAREHRRTTLVLDTASDDARRLYERLGWVKDLGRIIGHEDDPLSHTVTLPESFTDVQRRHDEWTSYLTPQALIDLVASRSYCITSPENVRTRTLDPAEEYLSALSARLRDGAS